MFKIKKMELKNKKIIIFGAAGMLGTEITLNLVFQGAQCILIDNDLKALNNLRNKIKKKSKQNYFIKADITDEKQLANIKKEIKKRFGLLDGMVNLIANDPKVKKSKSKSLEQFTNIDIERFKQDLNVGLIGAVSICKYFVNLLKKNSYSSVVNIASDLSIISPDHRIYSNKKKNFFSKPISYSIIKYGIVALTKYLATYYGPQKIRFNSISPGGIEFSQSKDFKKKISKLIPLGRMAKKNEINSALIYLLSPKSSYTNGINRVIDGGRSIW